MVIKLLTEVRKIIDENSDSFNKETGNIRKYQIEVTEIQKASTALKNTLGGFNNRLDKAKEKISELKAGNWISSKQSSKKKNNFLQVEASMRQN